MDSTGGAIIGVSAIGIGTLIAYGAYKDIPVFGPTGLLTQALQTGKLQKIPATTAAGTTTAKAPAKSVGSIITSIPGNILKGLLP